MRTRLPALFLLFTLLIGPVAEASSSAPEDLEASGDDLEMEGSGSGGWEDQVILDEKSTRLGSSKDGFEWSWNNHRSAENHQQEINPWDREHTVIQESRGFMESKEVLAGVIAGGVGGLVLAVLLGGILIYKWQRKDPSGYAPGHRQEQCQTDSDSGALRGEDMVLV